MARRGNNRTIFQLAWAALTNGYALGYVQGRVFSGWSKSICLPGLNCYSCPGALGACPIGSLQAMEALRLLLGLRLPPPAGEGVILQFDGRLREIRFERRANCTTCGKTAGPGTQSLADAERSPVNGSA